MPELNSYLAEQANQDVKRGACGCWVAVASEEGQEVLGYYTLSAEAVEMNELPELRPALQSLNPEVLEEAIEGAIEEAIEGAIEGAVEELTRDRSALSLVEEVSVEWPVSPHGEIALVTEKCDNSLE